MDKGRVNEKLAWMFNLLDEAGVSVTDKHFDIKWNSDIEEKLAGSRDFRKWKDLSTQEREKVLNVMGKFHRSGDSEKEICVDAVLCAMGAPGFTQEQIRDANSYNIFTDWIDMTYGAQRDKEGLKSAFEHLEWELNNDKKIEPIIEENRRLREATENVTSSKSKDGENERAVTPDIKPVPGNWNEALDFEGLGNAVNGMTKNTLRDSGEVVNLEDPVEVFPQSRERDA